jgi:HlyD family secretion protein
MTKYVLLMFALTLLAAGAMWLDQQSRAKVEPARIISEPNVVHASGRVEGATQDVKLRFEMSGRIAESYVREGQFVQAGTLLLRLDQETQRQRVSLRSAEKDFADAELRRLKLGAHEHERLEAKSLLEARQAELKLAKQIWERGAQLRPGTISKQEKEDNQARLDTLIHQVAAAKAHLDFINAPPREDEVLAAEARCDVAAAQLEMARVELAKTELTAPSAGVIAKLSQEPGELTGPDIAEPTVLLVDTRQMRVRAYVEEQDASRVAVGQIVQIHLESRSGQPLAGEISELAPRMSRKQAWSDQPDERYDLKTREVLISLRSTEGLLPGLAVDVEIHTTARPEELPGISKVQDETPDATERLSKKVQ